MFRNKVDVDRHVVKTLAKVKSERDRNFRSYSFARLYFDVGDFESCVKYVEMYLSVKDNNPAAHTLLGQAYQKLGKVEKALAAFKTSLEFDSNQSNLILKVCELLGSESYPLEAGSARYWAERAASAFPDHPALYTLRARLLSAEGAGAPATTALLRTETAARPRDPAPHARLLRHLASAPQEAFAYAFQNIDNFADSIVWNEAVHEILEQSNNNEPGWEFWLLKLTVLERLAELSLAEGRRPQEAACAIWKLDRTLYKAAETIIGVAPSRTLGAETLSHFGAQFCLHMATLLLKKAGREAGEWRESVRAAAPLLLLALQPAMPPKAPPAPAPSAAPGSSQRLLSSWYLAAAYRRSQAGHTLNACAKDKKKVFLEKISQYCSGAHWRDKLYRKVFTSKEHLDKMSASFLLTNSNLAEVALLLPKSQDLQQIDRVAALLRPGSLHHQAWLGSNSKSLADFCCVGMDELRISVNNLSNCGAETLNKLDLDTFLYCTVLTAKKTQESEYKSGYWDNDRPKVLPPVLTPQLCTPAQAKWWEAACRIKVAAGTDLNDSRLTLTRGIETVRCVGSHGLDPELLVEVARAFSRRAEDCKDSAQRRFLEARANLCYSTGVPLLERIRNNISIRPPEKRLFDYTRGELPQEKLETLIEEGKLYLAEQCVNDKDDDKAIEILETIKSPYASFYLYKIYKKLADEITPERERSDPEKRTKRALCLTKAREFVYLTSDRLKAMRADNEHPLYLELGDNIQNIELSFSRMEPTDSIQADENNVGSSDEESWPGSSFAVRNSSLVALTPRSARSRRVGRRAEPQPSPESLEAQIRQLQRKNSVISAFVEQTKVLVESNRTLVDEVREMKKALGEIKSHNIEDTVDQFRSLKLSVDEVKSKINESAADVADLKKEITELKNELGKIKSSPVERPREMDENELYMLEEEAGAYLQRQQPAPVLPAQAYPIYPPGALYPLYGQYPGVPQLPMFPGALFQDQPLYSELLAQRSLPAPQPVQAQAVPAAFPSQVVPPAVVAVAPPPVHDYHIPLPQRTTSFPAGTSTSTPNKPFGAISLEQNTPKPFSLFDSPKPGSALGSEATKPFSFLGSPGTFDFSVQNNQSSVNKSRTLSERSTDSYDPIPDFKPIINLPDEVAVMTGEEGEEVLFDARAKLFRFISKEWKERGLGQIKLLRNNTTGKIRVLMRRERVHTICANHFITPEIEISPMKDREKAYFWGANDFADETLNYEMFCIRFKTVDTGNEFYEKFCVAITESTAFQSHNITELSDSSRQDESVIQEENDNKHTSQEITVGGLKFFNTPTFKSVPDSSASVATSIPEASKPNPFAGFTFNKNTTASNPSVNVFSPAKVTQAPIAEMKPAPVNPNENVFYEAYASVSMTDTNSMVYRDKGVSRVKIFAPKKENKKCKLVLIQEHNGNVLCDIPLTKELKYDELMLQPNTLILTLPEAISVRIAFPSPDVYSNFKTVSSTAHIVAAESATKAQTIAKAEKKPVKKPVPTTKTDSVIPTMVSGWGDQFKPKAGSWDCKSCYINNMDAADTCVACNTPKNPVASKTETKAATLPAAPAPPVVVSGWGDQFKPKSGSWDCKSCYINNVGTADTCVACNTPKNPAAPKTETKAATTPAVVSGWGDQFKPKSGSWDCKSCYINNVGTTDYCIACDTPKDPSMPKKENKPAAVTAPVHTFTFGIPSVPAPNGAANPTPATSIFGGLTTTSKAPSTFTFGFPTVTVEKTTELNKEAPKTVSFADLAAQKSSPFGFPQKNTFEFSLKPKSPPKDAPGTLEKSHDSDNEYAAEDDGDHITFTPIIPLPDMVEVKTGEEEEEVLYKHLAKLYRFASSEWKECGVGDIKILKHPDTGKLRVLMRREPIHKICLNHALTADVEYLHKDDKTWLFNANDFSSGEITPTRFCVRFKTPEIANGFLSAIKEARAGLPAPAPAPTDIVTVTPSTDDVDEVVFVTESTVSEEEKALAKKFLLPENFYAYKQKAPCKGCIGCNPDDYVFLATKEIKEEKKEEPKLVKTEKEVKKPEEKKPEEKKSEEVKKIDEKPAPALNAFIFGQKPSITPIGNNTAPASVTSVFSSPSSLFSGSGTNVFHGKGESVSIFSGKSPESDKKSIIAVPKFTPATELPPPAPAAPIISTLFGGQPLFSTNVFSANSTSIFGNSPAKTEVKGSNPVAAPTFSFNTNTDSGSIFGTPKAKDQNSLFKIPNPVSTASSPQANALFGNAVKSQSLFASSNTSLFSSQPAGGTIFGGTAFGASDPAKPAMLFGQGNNTSIFGGAPVIAADVNKIKEIKTEGENGEKEAPPIILKTTNPDMSFAALAAKNSEVPFQTTTTETGVVDNSKNFNWAGAGTPLFGAGKGQTPKAAGHDDSQEDGAAHEDSEYDPHYEPVVPMPDEIKVVTGEEDETVKFEQKVKLFRFVGTEWKERAIGSFRLLFHPQRRTYRLLMRQSQVHKVVLNQLITHELQLMPMAKSERAFMWAGLNYTEDNPAGEVEKLAVRFTNQDQAKDFSNRIQTILAELEERAQQDTSKEEGELGGDAYAEDQHEEHETDEEEDEDDPYARDNMHVMFESQADMGGMECCVVLLSTGDAGYLRVYNAKDIISETYVTEGAYMEREKATLRWTAVCDGEADDETMTVDMPDEDTATELLENFYELINYK